MPSRGLLFAASFVLVALAAGCAKSDTDREVTVLGTPTTPATIEDVSATATATPDIQDEGLAAVQEFINQNGGEVDPAEITLADLTGDGTGGHELA